jgi:hypothetical protein
MKCFSGSHEKKTSTEKQVNFKASFTSDILMSMHKNATILVALAVVITLAL